MTGTTNPTCDTTSQRRGILRCRTQTESLSTSFDTMSETDERKVSFATVQIHEHPMVLCDNPGGLSGPPLSLDWKAQACYEIPLDKYEKNRPERRNKHELALPDVIRIEILRNSGYSRSEIVARTRPVNIARTRRMSTIKGMKRAGFEEFTERVSHKARNILSLGRRKREERMFLTQSAKFDIGKVGEKSSFRTEDTLDLDLLGDGGEFQDDTAVVTSEQANVEPLTQ